MSVSIRAKAGFGSLFAALVLLAAQPVQSEVNCWVFSNDYCSEDEQEGNAPCLSESKGTPPPKGSGDCDECGGKSPNGMPVWWVSEPRINLRLEDVPLRYQPPYGPEVVFQLSFRQRGNPNLRNGTGSGPILSSVGGNWSCNLIPLLVKSLLPAWHQQGVSSSGTGAGAGLAGGGLGLREYRLGETQFSDGSVMQPIGNLSQGYRVYYPDGSVDFYEHQVYKADGCFFFLLTRKQAPTGLALTNHYETVYVDDQPVYVRLASVTDAAGGVTTLQYTNANFPELITGVTDPYGRQAGLEYDDDGELYQITDTAGVATQFSGYNEVFNLITPAGTTVFTYGGENADGRPFYESATNVNRWLKVTLPDNSGTHLYLYRQVCTNLVARTAEAVPDTASFGWANRFDQLDQDRRNSLHWGPLQYAALSADFVNSNFDVEQLTPADYALGRLRHWLIDPRNGFPSSTLSLERSPSPDGVTPGVTTWYDYPGKGHGANALGNAGLPNCEAQLHPVLGSYLALTYVERNQWLHETNRLSLYTQPNGRPGLRTDRFEYDPYGLDLTRHLGPNGAPVVSNVFNGFHQVTTRYNALNERTEFRYDDAQTHLLLGVTRPTGLSTTFGYDHSARLTQVVDLPIHRTNSFTYDNQGGYPNRLVRTQTDARGLTVTYFWDRHHRLTGMLFPDGTTRSNVFSIGAQPSLELTATKDRLDHWTYFGYDANRRLVAITNANAQVTAYGYCDCGALTSVTNALGTPRQEETRFAYDFAGNPRHVYLPDGTIITHTFDPVGRLIASTDGTASRSFTYNDQGLLASVATPDGSLGTVVYDLEDRPTSVTDASGVTVVNTFDALGRLRTRTGPDGAVEQLSYAENLPGPISHSHPSRGTTFFAYDAAGQLTELTNAKNETLRYTHDPAGDLLSLTDGKHQTTRWTYDEYGRVTNKTNQVGAEGLRLDYDAEGRVLRRWTPAKGTTAYTYDPLGNLTHIDYPTGTNVALAYNELNELTTLVDAIGTTTFNHAPGGLLASEDGPWNRDTLTFGYTNRLRTSLGLEQPAGDWSQAYSYDTTRRLTNLSSPAGTFTYQYVTDLDYASPLVQTITLPNTATINHVYDPSARLLGTTLKNSQQSTLNSHHYTYQTGGQRATQTRTDGSSVSYTYDEIGQLTQALGSGGQSPEHLGFGYDAAWNLSQRTNGPTVTTFNVDGKNQLTTAPDGTCVYDLNGNLVSAKNGQQTYGYDDENRLTRITQYASANVPSTQTALAYDGLSRLRSRREYTWVATRTANGSVKRLGTTAARAAGGSGTWQLSSETRYVYDGMRVIQERNGNNVPLVSYTRGTDLSGSFEGAGGIGGLLGRSHGYHSGSGAWNTHNYYHADGAGNVTYLVNSSQTLAASYRYDPFGNLLASTGPLAAANVYRFSSKEVHLNSGLYAYGYRFYSPNWQRWLNQDPLGELGGLNLYGFVGNAPANYVDPLGLKSFHEHMTEIGQGIYDWMMGDESFIPDPNTKAALDAQMLGGIDPHNNLLRDVMGEAAALAAEMMKEGAEAYAGGKLLEGAGAALGGTIKFCRNLKRAKAVEEAANAAERGIGRSVNAPNFYSVPNQGGGRVWFSTDLIEQVDFARLVNAGQREGSVTVLTGTHGTKAGNLIPARKFFQEDLATWASQTANVKLIDVTKLSPGQMQIVINRRGRIVCAWCYSGNSTAVQSALAP